MSAVAALLRIDGGPVDPGAMDTLLSAMHRRGPDGTVLRQDGAAAIGCGLFGRTDGGFAAIGEILVSLDGRIDNRSDLRARFNVAADIPDAALIAAAWRRHGEDCAAELLGDFAFILWDGAERRLFAACDGFAVRSLAYAVAPDRIGFASDPSALRRLGFGGAADETVVADILRGMVPDPAATPHSGIAQFTAGQCCTVMADGQMRLRRYWQLAAPEPRARPDAPAELRALLAEAVRARLGAPAETASLLSGGLDSSSITRVAAETRRESGAGPLRTYSLVFDATPDHSERPFIEAVLARGGCDPVLVSGDDLSPFAAFEAALDAQDMIFLGPNHAAGQRLHRAARAGGTRVLLDGHGGDEVISHGTGMLAELAIAGSWGALWREVGAFARHQSFSAPRHFAAYAVQFGLPPGPRRLVRAVARRRRAASPATSFVDADFVRRAGRAPSPSPQAPLRHEERFAHLRTLDDPRHGYAFRVLDRAGVASGLSLRFPFWDRRLVEFCLSLPAGEKMANGVTRLALRRAMEGVLPPSVQWRPDKLDFTVHLVRGLVIQDRPIVEDVLADSHGHLRGYVDAPAARAAYAALVADPDRARSETVFALWHAVAFGLWQRRLARS